MQFRLGSFEVHGAQLVVRLVRLLERQRRMREATREGLAGRPEPVERLSADPPPAARPPCLLEACPEGHPDHEWLVQAHAALGDTQALGTELQACEAEPGPDAPFTLVATAWRTRGEVRRDDVVQAGFVLQRTPDSALRLQPRLFRISCANGAVAPAGVGEAHEIAPSDLRAAISDMLSHRKLEAEVARLALAAARTVEDPVEALLRARTASNAAQVLREFERGRDPSYWGLINAITAVARATPDWHRRIEQERDAGGILALLEHDPGSRRAGHALQVPRTDERLAVHA